MEFFKELFVESWLCENPKRVGPTSTYYLLCRSLNDYISSGFEPVKLSDKFWKLEAHSIIYYWYSDGEEPDIIIELSKKPQSANVNAIGKKTNGVQPWATDLYDDILKDRGGSITIFSDDLLSDNGYTIWVLMLANGRNISVYDAAKPGATFQKINSVEELRNYFGDTNRHKDYRFVLSENWNAYTETMSYFLTRRTFELSGRL